MAASKIGFLAYGTTDFAVRESLDQIKKEYGKDVDYMRIRAYPFAHEIHDFVASHERVYVVEQNRDAQLASLLKLDLPAEQAVKLRSILHYNGLPHRRAHHHGRVCDQGGPLRWQPQRQRPKVNHIGLPIVEYRGGKTTLCAGCGHNAISERIIDAMYEMGVQPERVMKMSGIGCSSKSPAYFMSRSHSFNSVHGRMPSVTTGAVLANHTMMALGVSGDGDTASIGIGQFVHLMRRNLPMIYIIEDNGVYGLTKGQFSATADIGSKLKTGVINDLPAIDTCALAIQLGATFVGRSFSGDKKQLLSMLKAAIAHKGTVMLDVISPCVTFNDHEGSTKSYKFMQENDEPINEIGFVASFDEIDVDYDSGQVYDVEMHDGSSLRLRKLLEDYDPTDKANAVRTLMEAHEKNEMLTGVFYIDTEKPTFIDLLNLVDEPLATLPESLTRPPKSALEA